MSAFVELQLEAFCLRNEIHELAYSIVDSASQTGEIEPYPISLTNIKPRTWARHNVIASGLFVVHAFERLEFTQSAQTLKVIHINSPVQESETKSETARLRVEGTLNIRNQKIIKVATISPSTKAPHGYKLHAASNNPAK